MPHIAATSAHIRAKDGESADGLALAIDAHEAFSVLLPFRQQWARRWGRWSDWRREGWPPRRFIIISCSSALDFNVQNDEIVEVIESTVVDDVFIWLVVFALSVLLIRNNAWVHVNVQGSTPGLCVTIAVVGRPTHLSINSIGVGTNSTSETSSS